MLFVEIQVLLLGQMPIGNCSSKLRAYFLGNALDLSHGLLQYGYRRSVFYLVEQCMGASSNDARYALAKCVSHVGLLIWYELICCK